MKNVIVALFLLFAWALNAQPVDSTYFFIDTKTVWRYNVDTISLASQAALKFREPKMAIILLNTGESLSECNCEMVWTQIIRYWPDRKEVVEIYTPSPPIVEKIWCPKGRGYVDLWEVMSVYFIE